MAVQQLSVFMENKAGRLADITETVAAAGANIRGFVISDTVGFGIVRFILNGTVAAMDALTQKGFTTSVDEVLVVDLSVDRPGGLAAVLRDISDTGVNVEYAYSLVERYLAISVADVDRACKLLQDSSIPVLTQADIDAL
ncbi:MAG: ACT domain-containing protein [Actinomycetes bacterium]|nr:ACT domain-containing protein [Actinomycetes bacterium]